MDYEKTLRTICEQAPKASERRALRRHLEFLDKEIADQAAAGQQTRVTQNTFDCLTRVLALLDAIGDARVAMNGGKK